MYVSKNTWWHCFFLLRPWFQLVSFPGHFNRIGLRMRLHHQRSWDFNENPQVLYSLPAVLGHRLVLWQLQWTLQCSCEKGTVSRRGEGEGGREEDVGREEWEEKREWNGINGWEKEEKRRWRGGETWRRKWEFPPISSLSLSLPPFSQRKIKGDNLSLYLYTTKHLPCYLW